MMISENLMSYLWWCWLDGGSRWRCWLGFPGSGKRHDRTDPGSPPLDSGRGSLRSDGWYLEGRKITELLLFFFLEVLPSCNDGEPLKFLLTFIPEELESAACDVTKGKRLTSPLWNHCVHGVLFLMLSLQLKPNILSRGCKQQAKSFGFRKHVKLPFSGTGF